MVQKPVPTEYIRLTNLLNPDPKTQAAMCRSLSLSREQRSSSTLLFDADLCGYKWASNGVATLEGQERSETSGLRLVRLVDLF